jgi:hypothetical protein
MNFKDDYVSSGYDQLHPILKHLLVSINRWSVQFDNKPITITDTLSTPERDKQLNRVSASHSEGRAADIRTNDMSKDKILAMLTYFNEKYIHLGYTSFSGVKRLMVYKANPPHIHMAIGLDVIAQNKSKYPMWEFPQHKRKVKSGISKREDG